MTQHEHDPHQSLAAGLVLVRQFVPAANTVQLQVRDCSFTGFLLTDVLTTARASLSVVDPVLLDNLIEDTATHFAHLPWGGLVGEDQHGTAFLDLPDSPVPVKTIWSCATCAYFSDRLRADRDRDHLRFDGAHYPRWYTETEDGITYA